MRADWKKACFGDLCDLKKDTCEPSECSSDVYIGLEHIDTGALSLKRQGVPDDVRSAKNRFKSNDILYGKLRPYLDKAVVADKEGICSTDILVFTPKAGIPSFFLVSLIHTQGFLQHAIKTTNGVNHPRTSWEALRNYPIQMPPFPEQKKIASVLSKHWKAVEAQTGIVENLRELKKSMMNRLFTYGLRGEPLKKTDIGMMPKSWSVKPFIEAVETIDYGYSISIPEAANENGIGIVSTADMTRDGKLLYEKIRKIEAPEKTISRLTLKDGDVLFNWRNSPELVGKTTIYRRQDESHIFASFILRIVCGERKSHNEYIAFLMNHFRETGIFLALARRAVNQANYNKNEISVLPIPVPEIGEQIEIASILHNIDAKIAIHEAKKYALEDLFKTMLNKLMTGAIRVKDLDIDTSEEEVR